LEGVRKGADHACNLRLLLGVAVLLMVVVLTAVLL
jgi:hypothetical protein